MSAAFQGEQVIPQQQSGDTFEINQFGIGRATVEFKTPRPNLVNALTSYLYFGAPHPTFPNLLLKERRGNGENGDIMSIQCVYEGPIGDLTPEDPTPPPEYSTDISLSSEPIETHPRYTTGDFALTSTQLREVRLWFDALGDSSVNATTSIPSGWSDGQQDLAAKKLKGVTSYLRPGIIYSIDYVGGSVSSTKVNNVGKIIQDPQGAPTLTGDKSWLFVGYNWTKRGNVFSLNEKYQASGPGGWDIDLYEV
jgi:hypothetical protein